jgi:Ca2+:H+ antiporter
MKLLLKWTTLIPILAWIFYSSGVIETHFIYQIVASVLLISSVMAAVHHSELIAHRVGEPYGTIILAIAITVIEVSIIVSLMIAGGQETEALARDTVYAATMLILNGIVGLCLFIGGLKFHVQHFSKHSVTIALVSIVSIVVFALVFPTFTQSVAGGYYSASQLMFASFACLAIYTCFLFAQTIRHKEYFLSEGEEEPLHQPETISNGMLVLNLAFLLISLGIVVLLAKTLSPAIEGVILSYSLPKALVGIIIAAIILLPEGISAINAARKNRLQTSLNLALGSALASIGLTIPVVSVVCYINGMNIILGLDIVSIILLGLSVFTVMLSLSSGRSNIVYGVVLLVNLVAFVYYIINP